MAHRMSKVNTATWWGELPPNPQNILSDNLPVLLNLPNFIKFTLIWTLPDTTEMETNDENQINLNNNYLLKTYSNYEHTLQVKYLMALLLLLICY